MRGSEGSGQKISFEPPAPRVDQEVRIKKPVLTLLLYTRITECNWHSWSTHASGGSKLIFLRATIFTMCFRARWHDHYDTCQRAFHAEHAGLWRRYCSTHSSPQIKSDWSQTFSKRQPICPGHICWLEKHWTFEINPNFLVATRKTLRCRLKEFHTVEMFSVHRVVKS